MDVDSMPPANNSMAAFGRNGSMDTTDSQVNPHSNMKAGAAVPPPMYQRGGYAYPPHRYGSSRGSLPIKSVVTTSFEEREDRMERRDQSSSFSHHHDYGYRHGHSPPHYGSGRDDRMPAFESPHQSREPAQYLERDQPHYGRELPPIREGDVEERHQPHEMTRGERRVPPSPRGEQQPYIHRSHSAGGPVPPSYRGQGPLKRSFWHHSRPGEEYQSLPNEFMPPKRSKVTNSPGGRSREYIVTARGHDDHYASDRQAPPPAASRSPGWFNRAMSWEASRDDYYNREPGSKVYTGSWSSRSPPYREGAPTSHWSDAPTMPSPRGRFGPESGYEDGQMWGRWHQSDEYNNWSPLQNRDEIDTSKRMAADQHHNRVSFEREMYRQGTFESNHEMEPPMRFVPGPPRPMEQIHSMMQARPQALASEVDRIPGSIRLLALPEDRISLSETLCLVREVSPWDH